MVKVTKLNIALVVKSFIEDIIVISENKKVSTDTATQLQSKLHLQVQTKF